MRKIMTGIAAAALAAGLAACGGSSPGSQPPTAAQVARQIGATDVREVSPPALYAYSEADAVLRGRPVDIATFRTNALRDSWVRITGQFAGIERTGDRYAVADG